MQHYHGTTIVSVRRGAQVALGGDGQVTLGHVVVKGGARKVRRIYHDKVLAGFAGGNGDVLDPEDGICAIGSGGAYAQAAARALAHNTELRPREIVDKSLEIAAELCIYTNQNRVIETLD